MSVSRDKIKPIVDVPLIFQLEAVYGQEVPSKFEQGIEYRFSVVHDSRPAYIYLPSSGRDAILQARPDPGDFIELLKLKKNNQVWFRAQVLSDAYEQAAAPPTRPLDEESPLHYRPRYENEPFARQEEPPPPRRLLPTPAPSAAPPPHPPEAPPPQRQQRGQYAGQALPPHPDDSHISPIAQQLAGCLRVSIDAWEEAVAYARSKGCELDYTSEDVRAVGLSFYINASNRNNGSNGNGGRR